MVHFQSARMPADFKSRLRPLRNSAAMALTVVAVASPLDARAQTVTTSGDVLGWWGSYMVGRTGTGTLDIAGGGILATPGAAYLGYDGGSQGTVTVTGANSLFSVNGSLTVGRYGGASLTISNGGKVTNATGSIGLGGGITGTVLVTGAGSLWDNSGPLTIGGFQGFGFLTIANGGRVNSTSATLGDSLFSEGTVTVTGSGSLWSNSGRLIIGNSEVGTLTISNGGSVRAGTYAGGSVDFVGIAGVAGSVGTLNIGAASGTPATAAGTLLADEVRFGQGTGTIVFNHTGLPDGSDLEFAAALRGRGTISHESGTTIFSGDGSLFTGTTTVSGGKLVIANKLGGSAVVGNGATLAGTGTIGSGGASAVTLQSGATLSPGNSPGTLTVQGNLTFNSGSTYLAEVQGANADRVDVSGTATLAGTLRLVALGGAYTFNSAYTLLSAAGGSTGSFSQVDTAGSFGDGVTTTVSYTANDVQLTLTPKSLVPIVENPASPGTPTTPSLSVSAPRNAHAIASAIDGVVANGGDPSSLFGIYNLPAASIPAAVNSLSGEVHTAAPAMANLASDQFLRAMLDPAAAGRLGAGAAGPGTAAFSGLARNGVDRPNGPARLDARSYAIWGSAYGSYGRTDGNAVIGSTKRSIDDAHLAAGIDVRLMPGTVAGIAVSGGKARASLPGVLGRIDADVFQAGLHGMTQFGRVRLGGALSYARLQNDVSRGIPALSSSLASSYATTAWSGRLQASAAILSWNGFSLSPLAAIQATQARSPAVIEANWAGADAGALALGRRRNVTARGELGAQLDADAMLGSVPVTGSIRAAWAHYARRDADLTASLVGLPGATFSATGARVDRNSALLSAGIAARLSERISFNLSLDGELSANSTRLGGAAQLRVDF